MRKEFNKKEEKPKGTRVISPVRMDKVLELRAIVNELGGDSMQDKLFEIFKDRDQPDTGFSKKELCLVFYPRRLKITDKGKEILDKKGNPIPSAEAKKLMDVILHSFIKSEYNDTVELDARKFYNERENVNEWIYYRIRTVKGYKPVSDRNHTIVVGFERKEERAMQRLTLKTTEIEQLETKRLHIIREKRRKKELGNK